MCYLRAAREKHLSLVSFPSLAKVCVNSPELPNGIYVSRAGSIRYLRGPREGTRDTRPKAQGKVCPIISAQSCQNQYETGYWGSNWSKKWSLEDVGVGHKMYLLCKFYPRRSPLPCAHCTVPIFTKLLFVEQKFQEVKL